MYWEYTIYRYRLRKLLILSHFVYIDTMLKNLDNLNSKKDFILMRHRVQINK